MTRPSPRHIPELDGLRGFLSWWVVLDHILLHSGYSVTTLGRGWSLLARGEYAVDVFIMLSGFVIYKLWRDRPERTPIFLSRRFLRLWPVYIVCLLGAIAIRPLDLFALHHAPLGDPSIDAAGRLNWESQQAHFVAHLAAHLPMLHGVIPDRLLPTGAVAFLAPAWSISLEWQFYLVAPLLFWLLRQGRSLGWLGFGVVAGLGWMLRYSWPLQEWSPMEAFLPQKLLLFAVGMISLELWEALEERGKQFSTALFGLSVVVLFFTLSLPLAIWLAALAAAFAERGVVKSALSSAPMQFLGRISYCTYLGHTLVLTAVKALVFRVWDQVSGPQMLIAQLLIGLPLIWQLSLLLHRWIEVPGIALGRKLRSRYA
jgi:peptidoglycan/LPS O-acetylase OafA/YrhL